ncbi:putative holin-like toxin [Bacillus lumedeiriae]
MTVYESLMITLAFASLVISILSFKNKN